MYSQARSLRRPALHAVLAISILGAFAACDQALAPGSDRSELALSFEVPTSGASFNLAPGDSTPAATLTLDSVQVVLARVKLHRDGDSRECADSVPDRCESFTAGPVLVNLPIKGGMISPFATRPLAGTYDRLEFKIHRPEGNDSLTRAFRASRPTWPAAAAVRLVGKYNTQSFDVFFRTEAHIRKEFEPPLTITDTTSLGSIGLTVSVDVQKWLVVNGVTVDPRSLTANPRLLTAVEKNIRESFQARHTRGKGGDDGNGHGRDKEKGNNGNSGNGNNGNGNGKKG